MERLDDIDLAILRILQEDSSLTIKELAARVNLSTTPIFERQKRLEREGYIKRYVAVLDGEKLGRGFEVFCNVKLKHLNTAIAGEFVEAVQHISEVMECYNISGEYDYILHIYVPDMNYYRNFLINVLGNIDSLGSVQSIFVMERVKNSSGFPL